LDFQQKLPVIQLGPKVFVIREEVLEKFEMEGFESLTVVPKSK